MPSQTIFTDDLVTKDGEIGIVDRAPNSSDEESDGDDIIDDADTSGRLPAGAAHVVWKNESKLRTELAANLSLADRLFLLGDIVARSNDQLGQTGIVVAMQMFFDLSCADGTVLKQVPGKVLQPLAACRPGALVVHQQAHWLGRVDEVYDNVYLAFDDGSECKVLRTDAESLRVATPTMDEQTWFWPSMRVTASRDTLKDTNTTKWIKGSYKSSYAGQPATVVKVQAAQALVRWLTSTPSLGGSEPSFTSPRESQRPSRLLELHAHHSRSCWRLGEHAAVLREDLERLRAAAEGGNGGAEGVVEGSAEGVVEGSAEGDGAPSAGCAGADTDGGAKKPPHAPRKNKNGENSAVDTCVEIVSCHTRVDVIWQDGTRLSDVAATTLAPAKHVDGYYEFWPQDFVVGKTTGDGSPPPDGVVESVNHEQRICVVTWRESRKREVIPVYEIAPHPDFNFKVGDVVLRLPGDGAGEHAHADGSAATALARLAFIGQVVSVGPQLQIRWMDGSESEAPPEELYVVNTEEEEEIPPEDEEAEGHDIEIRDLDSGAHFGAGRQAQRAGEADAADDEAGESSGWETLLQDGLPPGIFVVAYAERVDLLRVLIVGPPGTPYHDAVFVFDLQLPADFPQQPPAVHYLSHGERINPNLYENGKVCLSLLGTWTGRESCELWNPKTSTVLQVLVSIQALVLCEQPYYNEAGYERQLGTDEGGHHARRYNEGAFLLSLKSMQTSLRYLSPPFEALTRTHFQKARARIVDRCRKLLELKAAHPEAMAMLNGTCSSTAGQAPSHATAPAGAAGGEGGGISAEAGSAEASANDQVSRAGFKGVLNTWPTLGFLHSLERSLPALEMSLDGVVDTPAEGGS